MKWMGWTAVGLVVLVGGAALSILLRDSATPLDPVTVNFSGAVGSDPGDPGLYSYATTGSEQVDALAGARHDYPATTLMTVTDGPCGPVVRWLALQERWIEWHHCGPELAITETLEYHEWFGIPDNEVEHCTTPRPLFDHADEVVCVAAESTETYRVELIGMESIGVGDQVVDTIHIRRTSSLSGASRGETTVEVWRYPQTPLIVRLELVGSSVTPSAVGDVTYREEFTLELLDLTPTG